MGGLRPATTALGSAIALLLGCGGEAPRARILRDDAVILEVAVELAETAAERRRGLAGHPPLGPDEGLLIVLPRALEVCVVNGEVEFAIDAVIAGEDGTVLAIERQIAAGSDEAHCHDAVRWILEVAAGGAAAVSPGDRLEAP